MKYYSQLLKGTADACNNINNLKQCAEQKKLHIKEYTLCDLTYMKRKNLIYSYTKHISGCHSLGVIGQEEWTAKGYKGTIQGYENVLFLVCGCSMVVFTYKNSLNHKINWVHFILWILHLNNMYLLKTVTECAFRANTLNLSTCVGNPAPTLISHVTLDKLFNHPLLHSHHLQYQDNNNSTYLIRFLQELNVLIYIKLLGQIASINIIIDISFGYLSIHRKTQMFKTVPLSIVHSQWFTVHLQY